MPVSLMRAAAAAMIGVVAVGVTAAPAFGQAGSPPPSALVNQRSAETLEAARAASPHTAESTFAYFEDEVAASLAAALEQVWDPTQPREPSPRTAWGDPDVSGYWLSVTYTPLQRPEALAGRPLYTLEEAIQVHQQRVLGDAAVDPATVHYDWTEFGMDNWQSPIRPNRRTSLIVDPPDGRMPAYTAEGRTRLQAQARRHTLESRGLFERCIVGAGPPRIPFAQQVGESQMIQTPDHVVLITQANSDVRVIPLNAGPAAPGNIRSWLGSSRGHFEGDTLVVETTHFHHGRQFRGTTDDLHLVERFTRVADDTLLYEATLTDSTTWEAPWTVEYPWPRLEPPGLFEFACHEQNYGIINVLNGARIRAAEYQEQAAR